MGHARRRPKRLAEKLLQIRKAFGLSQSELLNRLGFDVLPNCVSKYEHDRNEPPTDILLAYARLAKVPLEQLIDDNLELLRPRSNCVSGRVKVSE